MIRDNKYVCEIYNLGIINGYYNHRNNIHRYMNLEYTQFENIIIDVIEKQESNNCNDKLQEFFEKSRV